MKPKRQHHQRLNALLGVLNDAAAKELPPEGLRLNLPVARKDSKQLRTEGNPTPREHQRS